MLKYNTIHKLHLDLSRHQDLRCSWTCIHHRGMSCTWTCLDNKTRAAPGHVYTTGVWAAPQRYELHMDLSRQQDSCCSWTCLHHRGMSCTTGVWAAPGLVWTTRPVLLLDMSTPQWYELHLDLSRQQDPCCSWTCLHHRGMSGTWTCLDNKTRVAPGHVYTATGA
jgi:hypothetical protein